VILADEIGLGKSVQALEAAMEFRCHWPLLIVTSASKKDQWIELVKSRIINANVLVLEKDKKSSNKLSTENSLKYLSATVIENSIVILVYE